LIKTLLQQKQLSVKQGLPVEKKTLKTAALISALLFSAIAGTMLVHLGKANPIMHYWVDAGDVAPDQNTKPPAILIRSPENNTVHTVDAVSLSIDVTIGDSNTASYRVFEEIYYETDWKPNNVSLYQNVWDPYQYTWHSADFSSEPPPGITEFSEIVNLTGIPDGDHSIMVYAVEVGEYFLNVTQSRIDNRNFAHYYNNFNITACSLVRFTVDTAPPEVSILSLENKTYYSSEIQLDFTVSEKSSLITYSLDGQENETITGNITLTNIPCGEHNVTVYATDRAGHSGASETIFFSVEEPFPITIVIAPVASVAVVGVGLILYFKKRKH
jgi:hypothetical protein